MKVSRGLKRVAGRDCKAIRALRPQGSPRMQLLVGLQRVSGLDAEASGALRRPKAVRV